MRIAAALLLLLGAGAAVAAGKHKAPAAASGALTPPAMLKEIPALPKAAKKDLDCSAKETIEARIQQVQADFADQDNPPAQVPHDLEFSSCVTDLQQRPPELWIDVQREKLDTKLSALDEAKFKAADNPATTKRFNGQAVAAATQFLKDAQPAYGEYLNDIGACVRKRYEMMVATNHDSGIATNGTQEDWDLVVIAAGAQSAVCNAAKDAAGRYLEPPLAQ